jgi:hypothetical protein
VIDALKISQLQVYDGKSLNDALPASIGIPPISYKWTVEELLNAGRTGLTGGGFTNLDGVVTAKEEVGQLWWVRTSGTVLAPYGLESGTLSQNLPTVVRPLDFSLESNPKIFRQLSVGATAEGSITIAGISTPLGGSITTTSILDSLGTTQGSLLYRGASTWAALAPSTSGYVLTSGGAGANPSWQLAPVSGVPSVTGTAGQVLINGGTGAVTTAATFALPSGITGVNTIDAASGIAFALSGGASGYTVSISGTSSGASTNTNTIGALLSIPGITYNNSGTGASSNDAAEIFTRFGQPTMTATNSNVTVLNAATIYIAGDPLAGTNVTVGTTVGGSWGLWNAGKSRLDGIVRTESIHNGSSSHSAVEYPNAGYDTGIGSTTLYNANAGTTATGVTVAHGRNSTTVAPFFIFAKTNSNAATGLTAVTSATVLGNFFWRGADGTGFITAAAITGSSDGTVSTGTVPGKIEFKTATTGGTLTTALTISSAQTSTFAGTVVTPASASAAAGLRLLTGSAPSSPVDGDMWQDGTNLKIRINGVTKTVLLDTDVLANQVYS